MALIALEVRGYVLVQLEAAAHQLRLNDLIRLSMVVSVEIYQSLQKTGTVPKGIVGPENGHIKMVYTVAVG